MLGSPIRFLLLLCASLATGCGQDSTVHIAKKFSTNESLLTSADVRSINRTKGTYVRGRVIPENITCAEPSPDIAKVVSESFNFGGSFGVGGLPSGITPEAAAAISLARAEGMAQLTQRLATIQLLRDGLYRACEAYSNGAMSDTTYALILSRFDDTMVTMLTAELAAGNFSGRLAALGTGAGGGSSARLSEAVRELIDNAEELAGAAQPPSGDSQTAETAQPASARSESSRDATKAAFANSMAQVSQIIAAESTGFRQNAEIAETLSTMQRKFIENINMDAMVVACVNALDNGRVDEDAEVTIATYKASKAAFKLDPRNTGKERAFEEAAEKYARVLLGGVKSPLANVCAKELLPKIADHHNIVLKHILAESRSQKRARNAAEALRVHTDAVYGYLTSAKIRELDLGDLESEREATKAEIKAMTPQEEQARAAADAQRLVRNDDESAANVASSKAGQKTIANKNAQTVLADAKHAFEVADTNWQAADKRALAAEKDAQTNPNDRAAQDKAKDVRDTANDRLKEKDAAKDRFDAASAVAGTRRGEALSATQEAETARAKAEESRKKWEMLQQEAIRLTERLDRLKAELRVGARFR